jgi:hypothetical protein
MIATMLAPPAPAPVGLGEAKDYLRTAGDGQNELEGKLIAASRASLGSTLRPPAGWMREVAALLLSAAQRAGCLRSSS